MPARSAEQSARKCGTTFKERIAGRQLDGVVGPDGPRSWEEETGGFLLPGRSAEQSARKCGTNTNDRIVGRQLDGVVGPEGLHELLTVI